MNTVSHGMGFMEHLAKKGGGSPVVKNIFSVERKFHYNPNKVAIGITDDDEILYIDFSESKKILIAGGTRSGKSFNARALLGRFYMGGGSVAIATDVKPEFFCLNAEVQPKFRKFLLQDRGDGVGETPQKFPSKSYYPYFFNKVLDTGFKDNITCQLPIADMNVYDFLTITDMDDNESQRQGMMDVFTIFQDKTHEPEKVRDVDYLVRLVETNEIIHAQTKKTIKRNIKLAVDMGVIGDAFEPLSFSQDLIDQKIPILNLYGFNRLGKFISYPAAFVSVLLRQMMAAKAEGKIPMKRKLLIVLDEVARFCPRTGNSTSKREILECLDLSGSYRISMLFLAQDINRVPPTILDQCNIVFLSHTTNPVDAGEIIKAKVPKEFTDSRTFNVEMVELMGQLTRYSNGQRDWLYINRDTQEKIIFTPFAPLSRHLEEGEN